MGARRGGSRRGSISSPPKEGKRPARGPVCGDKHQGHRKSLQDVGRGCPGCPGWPSSSGQPSLCRLCPLPALLSPCHWHLPVPAAHCSPPSPQGLLDPGAHALLPTLWTPYERVQAYSWSGPVLMVRWALQAGIWEVGSQNLALHPVAPPAALPRHVLHEWLQEQLGLREPRGSPSHCVGCVLSDQHLPCAGAPGSPC